MKRQMDRKKDTMVEATGFGIYQIRVIVTVCFIVACESLEINLLTFLSPCIKRYWDTNATAESTLSSVVFATQFFGTIIWGLSADSHGRRFTALGCTAIMTVFGLCSAAAGKFWVLCALRSVVGFALGGTGAPYILLQEVLPPAKRGAFAMSTSMSWVAGSVYVYGVAWLVLEYKENGVVGWRALVLFCAVPSFVGFIGLWQLWESPRWLYSKGRSDEARRVLAAMARENAGTTVVQSHNEKSGLLSELAADLGDALETTTASPCVLDPAVALNRLLEPPFRNTFLALLALWLNFGFSYFGVVLIIAEAYSTSYEGSCGGFDYAALFVVAMAEGVGNFLALLVVDRIGRRVVAAMAYCCNAVAIVAVALLDSTNVGGTALLAACMVARAANGASTSVSWVQTPEILPTWGRGFGFGACQALQSIGNVAVCYFVWDSGFTMVEQALFVAAVSLAAAALTWRLPETKGEALLDDIPPLVDA